MILLIAFAFLAGVVTVLSPCILPLLPIILSSADGSSKQRPLGVVLGFILSFTFFTLFLSTIVQFSGIPADSLRFISIIILIIFGASLLIPWIQAQLEILFSRFSNIAPVGQNRTGLLGGLLVGLSLGLLWTPCVGPILASVISLAITGTVTAQAFFITLSFSVGTAIPMFIIMMAGGKALQKVPWLVRNTSKIQQAFGVLMILTAVGIYFSIDRQFQTYILKTFPQYGTGLTRFEETESIKNQLEKINQPPTESGQNKSLLDVVRTQAPPAPELKVGGEWFNSEPLQLTQLRGKVVLIDFWTYSCINCQRTLPYLKTWWTKYQSAGLVIIGVHAPEFEFEKNPKNVQQAITDFEIQYPVMQDNEFKTWRAYDNRYWPAKYLIDKDGNIRYTHFGEGQYDQTEEMIRQLLEETGAQVSTEPVANPAYRTSARTPETYLGYGRLEYLASPERVQTDQPAQYTQPSSLRQNEFAYQGTWTVMQEHAAPSAGSSLYFNFEAQEVYLVARPKTGTSSGTIKVFVDDTTENLGVDAPAGVVTVNGDKLYKLVKLPKAGKHQLRLEFPDSNLEIYAFTFG